MVHRLFETNSIINKFISEIRNVATQNDRMRFRRNMERIGEILAYEISKTLTYSSLEVETPFGMSQTSVPADKMVLATILRAGLPLHNGILSYFDQADNAFISAFRQHHKDGTFEINMQYITCPSLENAVVILSDPLLATGASIEQCLLAFEEYGKPKEIHVAVAIASSNGLSYIKRKFPKVHLWVAAEDEELTAKSYIVPGLGDAGDLSYGPKLQE